MKVVALVAIVLASAVFGDGLPQPRAAWTLMVYVNAKNNLEPDAIDNFLQMAQVGSTDRVNILVEMGRPDNHYTNEYGAWSTTLRFRVTKGMEPTKDHAIADIGKIDMGSGNALADFVAWSRKAYPADHEMLVVWDHGQGWRLKQSRNFQLKRDPPRGGPQAPVPADAIVHAPYRSISVDDDFRSILYNRDLQDSLTRVLRDRQLDVIGFDACLMAMLETGYAIRKVATFMIGSEELEPGTGWNYERWLAPIVKSPNIDPKALAASTVTSYRAQYGDVYMTTLSAVDLRAVGELTSAVNRLADGAVKTLGNDRAALRTARQACRPYGTGAGLTNSVDLACVVDSISSSASLVSLHAASKDVRASINKTVVANYASKRMLNGFGSNGISIYFPATKEDHTADPDHDGYEPDNPTKPVKFPVEFVQEERWAPFLRKYLGL
jgi:Clostripain family